MRLNKYIARSGVTSRRKADDLIEAGLVKVNGEVVTRLGTRVQEGDEVAVEGRSISPQEKDYILLNKPENTVTTTQDRHGRAIVMDCIELPREKKDALFPVGRLDRDTVGVLLLTTDGELGHRLMHPRYEVEKLYRVRTRDSVKPHQIDQLRRGVELDDGRAGADDVFYTHPPQKDEVGMVLHEGRNRQIHRMMAAIGHKVTSLERVGYAGLTAEGVSRGAWRRLQSWEVHGLRQLVELE